MQGRGKVKSNKHIFLVTYFFQQKCRIFYLFQRAFFIVLIFIRDIFKFSGQQQDMSFLSYVCICLICTWIACSCMCMYTSTSIHNKRSLMQFSRWQQHQQLAIHSTSRVYIRLQCKRANMHASKQAARYELVMVEMMSFLKQREAY